MRRGATSSASVCPGGGEGVNIPRTWLAETKNSAEDHACGDHSHRREHAPPPSERALGGSPPGASLRFRFRRRSGRTRAKWPQGSRGKQPFDHSVVQQQESQRENDVVQKCIVSGKDDPDLERRDDTEARDPKPPRKKQRPHQDELR